MYTKLDVPVSESFLAKVEKRADIMGIDKIAVELNSHPGLITACTDVLRGRKYLEQKIRNGIDGLTTNITLSEVQKKFDFFKVVDE